MRTNRPVKSASRGGIIAAAQYLSVMPSQPRWTGSMVIGAVLEVAVVDLLEALVAEHADQALMQDEPALIRRARRGA